jgi:hypothetical protein
MQNYLYEFPAFDDVLPSLEGFEDSSWHNDACPSLTKELGNGNYLQIFIDWKNKEMSDFADLEGDNYGRFSVQLNFDDGNREYLLTTNNWDEVQFLTENFKLIEGV